MYYADVVLPAVAAAGFDVLDPWAAEAARPFERADPERDPARRLAAFRHANEVTGQRNETLIRAADALLAILDGTDVDSGTAAEVVFAAALGTPIVGVRGDLRRAGDNEATLVNLQVEHFIRSTGGRIVRSLEGRSRRWHSRCADERTATAARGCRAWWTGGYSGIAALAAAANQVITTAGRPDELPHLVDSLPTFVVGLDCRLDVPVERQRARTRPLEWGSPIGRSPHDGSTCDVRYDTSRLAAHDTFSATSGPAHSPATSAGRGAPTALLRRPLASMAWSLG